MRSGGQPERRAGLELKRWAIAAECKRRGWQLVEVGEEAGFSAEELERPGIQEVLRVLESAEAKGLVARKLDKHSRSLLDLACLIASARKQGWALVALECTPEPRTPAGEAAVNVLAGFAPCERGLSSQRIRQALALRRAQGVRLGRPRTMSPYAIERIRRERSCRQEPRRDSRTDSTRMASPPRRAAAAGTRPPSATRSTAQIDAFASSQIAGRTTADENPGRLCGSATRRSP